MIQTPPRSTRSDTLFPYTTLFRAGRAEPVLRGWLSHLLELFAHRHIRHRLFATDAGKDNGAAGKAKFRAPLDDADSARAEWHHMLPVCLHTALGDGPQAIGKVDLIPSGAAHLARPGGSEDGKFEGEATE